MNDEQVIRGEQLARSGKYAAPSDNDDFNVDDATAAREILGSAGMISACELDQQVFPALQWHVPGLVPEGFGLLVAPPKAGKSWLVASLGLACASGGKAFGCIDVEPRPVLYLALEDGKRRLQDRHRLLLGRDEEKPKNMKLIFTATPLTAPTIIAAFLTLHGADRALVIVDTLVKVRPVRRPGDDPYQSDYTFTSGLRELLQPYPGAGLLAVHHARKATSEDFVDTISGTNGIAAAADHLLVLKHPRLAQHGSLLVTGRDVPEGEYGLMTDQGHGWRLDGDDLSAAATNAETRQQQGRLGDRSLELVTFFDERGPAGGRPAEAATATGIATEQVYVYLARLVEAGVLVKEKRGLYRRAVSYVRSVSSEADESAEPPTSNITNTLFSQMPLEAEGQSVQSDEYVKSAPAERFRPPTGAGRCDMCGCHVETQGHKPDCPANTEGQQ